MWGGGGECGLLLLRCAWQGSRRSRSSKVCPLPRRSDVSCVLLVSSPSPSPTQVLGALASVMTVWLVTGVLLFEAVQRIITPEYVDGKSECCCPAGLAAHAGFTSPS